MGTERGVGGSYTGGGAYRACWSWVAGLIAALAVLAAIAFAGSSQFWAIAATGLAVGVCAGVIVDLPKETMTARSAFVFGGYGCVGAVATLGLNTILGNVGTLVMLTLAATSPVSIGLASRSIRALPRAADWLRKDDEEERLLKQQLGRSEDSDTAALLRGWRASSAALARTRSRTGWLAVAQQREAYLDELERRDPEHFAAWIATHPRADDDPTSYFASPGDEGTHLA
jgi:hypothetical protein